MSEGPLKEAEAISPGFAFDDGPDFSPFMLGKDYDTGGKRNGERTEMLA